MVFVLIEHLVGDFEIFKKVYLDDGDRRRMSGSNGGRVYCAADDHRSRARNGFRGAGRQ